jgi:uncharacterized protein
VEFEWDESKRQWNIENRGLDFADVARFDFAKAVTRKDVRRAYGEVRYNTIGPLDGRVCTFCWTFRDGRIRIISLRKANDREIEAYRADAPNS